MGHGHGHGQAQGHGEGRAADRRRLVLVLLVSVAVIAVELVGAWLTGSLALAADAGHVASDAVGVALALGASYAAMRPPTARRTFGLHRAEVLAALANAVVMLGLSAWLLWTAIGRLRDPVSVDAGPLVVFALVGLLANVVALAILTRGDTSALHMRSALLEVLGDAVGSALVVVSGIVILLTDFHRADAIASILIAVLIAPRALLLLRDTVLVLLEATPAGLDLEKVRGGLVTIDGVVGVHDLHAWTITSGMLSLSAHVTVADDVLASRGVGAVLDDLADRVATDHGIRHATFQVEPASHREHEDLGETGCG
ncbi:cation diffusion facilitator family transporter [Nocardioides cavernaquae]|uniref:Cation transporter n=1 Tax=Nocardioides cavernaquae TaxID=2321396 RepID=A0A3A5HD91_9ACTN|nr:cation diffusion facilitator family transporter [Nocardioides cavernaquae]RJS45974.1 cation transporter [Nocardioides cavernaquae]